MRKLKLEELNRVSPEVYKSQDKVSIVVILDNIRSGMNVGSFFRSADAFSIEKIYLCGITSQPPHREILKTAIGSTETVDWEYEDSVEHVLLNCKESGYTIIGIEQTDRSVLLHDYEIESKSKFAILFGNEVRGVSDKALPHLDTAIEIPQYGTKHSLNVAVCGGIILHHFSSALRS